MVPEQYTADGLELTDYLRKRFGQDKVYLVGQSWGTMLGIWMVQERPGWFAAYVGIGQMTNPVEDDLLIYDSVLSHLEVPVFFAEGRYDLNAMTVLAERYFNALDAPQKQLVWFEHSGHNPGHEEAAAFNDFMINTVLAQTRG